MQLVLGANFDMGLLDALSGYPVQYLYGSPSRTSTGHGRSPTVIGDVDMGAFREYLDAARSRGLKMLYTMNAAALNGRERELSSLVREAGELLEAGVAGFIVAVPVLLRAIKEDYPDAEVSASSFALLRGGREVERYAEMGANVIIMPEDANRDFGLLEAASSAARGLGAELELIVNNTCLYGCPYRISHMCLVSASSSEGGPSAWYDYPVVLCSADIINDPAELIRMRWIRPEDLGYYEEVGVDRFKLSSRGLPTEHIVRMVRAYSSRRYEGNLLDIMSWQQRFTPMAVRRAGGPPGYDALLRMEVDNSGFPEGWLDAFRHVDCSRTRCSACKYCDKVAERVIRVGGRSIEEVRLPLVDAPMGMVPRFFDQDVDPGGDAPRR